MECGLVVYIITNIVVIRLFFCIFFYFVVIFDVFEEWEENFMLMEWFLGMWSFREGRDGWLF